RLESKCNQNISIYGGILDNNRRNGISIVCCDSLRLENTILSNTFGNSPMSGIDLEPNDNKDVLDNIEIIKPITFNNAGRGILIYLKKLEANLSKDVNISIISPHDQYSLVGLEFQSGKLNSEDERKPISGRVYVSDPQWLENSKSGFHNYSPGNNVELQLRNVTILKKNFFGKPVV